MALCSHDLTCPAALSFAAMGSVQTKFKARSRTEGQRTAKVAGFLDKIMLQKQGLISG
jgi:hypothetical protein